MEQFTVLQFQKVSITTVLVLTLVGAIAAQYTPRIQNDEPVPVRTHQVPYQRTLTNHYLVRVRIEGRGPFNFLVDTGAPALFISTETARVCSLQTGSNEFWTPVKRFEIEGGITLENVKARVENPFQLEGMNALGLPGAEIHGILGYTVLGRFKLELDPTLDRMTWTPSGETPKEPYVPMGTNTREIPANMQAMNLLGPAMKLAAVVIGRQPRDDVRPQGFLGIILADHQEAPHILTVIPGTPASASELQAGDLITKINQQVTASRQEAHRCINQLEVGQTIVLTIKRGGIEQDVTLKATEGL